VIPEIHCYWQRQFLDGDNSFTASLQGGDGPEFEVFTEAGARNNVFAGAGVSVIYNDRYNGYFGYIPQFGGGDVNAHSIIGGVGFNF